MSLKPTINKTIAGSIMILASILCSSALQAEVSINFEEPQNFSDAADSDFATERTMKPVLSNLESFMKENLQSKLGNDLEATVTITDIDLAGNFEPWNPYCGDVRIVKRIYPARLQFHYSINDQNGNVVEQGSHKLRHDGFYNLAMQRTNRSYPYVKELFSDWVRSLEI